MAETIRKYYVVKTTFYQVKPCSGGAPIISENETGTLIISEGYYQCSSISHLSGHRFEEPPSAAVIKEWDGFPWYYRIKTAEVIEVNSREVREFTQTVKSLGLVTL
jgi:hypothetical protein